MTLMPQGCSAPSFHGPLFFFNLLARQDAHPDFCADGPCLPMPMPNCFQSSCNFTCPGKRRHVCYWGLLSASLLVWAQLLCMFCGYTCH